MTQANEAMQQTQPNNDQQLAPQRGGQAVVMDDGPFANLLDTGKFNHLWRVAQLFASSDMVPKHFQNKPADCFIATQMAIRLGIDPFMFLQNTYVTQGKPGMEGKLAIALINSSGLFQGPLQFELTGSGNSRGCTAWAMSKATGTRVDGPRVTVQIAMDEGWYQRNPKWKNVTDLMLQYRAGAWFGRVQCPERLMGMQTVEELTDTEETKLVESRVIPPAGISRTKSLADRLSGNIQPLPETQLSDEEAARIIERRAAETRDRDGRTNAPADASVAPTDGAEPEDIPQELGDVAEEVPDAAYAGITRWEDFVTAMEERAKAKNLDPEAFDKLMKTIAVRKGWAGRNVSKADPVFLRDLVHGADNDEFDWKSGWLKKAEPVPA